MQCYNPISLNEQKRCVPCGKCIACLQKRRSDWSFRLGIEQHYSKNAYFLTLTYSDYSIPTDYSLDKSEIQKYIKRIRKENSFDNLKYYIVGEYGTNTQRPHYHGIIFNVDKNLLIDKWKNENNKPKGYAQLGSVTTASIHYVTKYLVNEQPKGYYKKVTKPFAIMSKKLGKNYINDNKNYHQQKQNLYVVQTGGTKLSMPRYYKEKIYTKIQLERIADETQILLNKQVENSDYYDLIQTRKAQKLTLKRSSKSIII